MPAAVADKLPGLEESDAQKSYRKQLEREETSKIAGDDIWNILYYAGIVLLGIIVMMVINSEGFQFLKASLGKMVGAAASAMDFIGKNPWLLFLLPLVAPLFKFLTSMGSRFGSAEGKSQKNLVDKLFSDPKFRGRNEMFSQRVRASYQKFTPEQRMYLDAKLKTMNRPVDKVAIADKIEKLNTNATAEVKAKKYAKDIILQQKNKANQLFGDMVTTMAPDSIYLEPSNLFVEGTLNSAQNAGDMLRSGKSVSKVDAHNVFLAVAALEKVEGQLKKTYGDAFETMKADIESTGRAMEAEIELKTRIAVINNTESIAVTNGGKPNTRVKLDPDAILEIVHQRAMSKLTKGGVNVADLKQAQINRAIQTELEITLGELDPELESNQVDAGVKLSDPSGGGKKPVLSFKPPKEYSNAVKKKSFFSNPKTTNSFGDVPPFKPPKPRFK
ncbi:hypothetical protein EXVG_00200 [Emiliania huxleyi virus 202]|nr:hypothetical protein EXVG_00200 [Emiliania huxleyi virus 202]AHA54182.1 putative membrane protein [Emiliania huxleyi virus 18]AHA55228.1 putative membrane protein [Emiliania huxleyi virus 156]